MLFRSFQESDICVILRGRAVVAVTEYITPNTEVVFDSSTIEAKKLPKLAVKRLGIPATRVASEQFLPKSYNVLIFGMLCKMLSIDKENGWKAILKDLGSKFKDKTIEQKNRDAFDFGYEAVFEKGKYSKPTMSTKESDNIYKNAEKTAIVKPSLCKGCGICIEKCPVGALSFGEDLGVFGFPVPKIDLAKCINCGNCRRFCPDGAIAVEKNQSK